MQFEAAKISKGCQSSERGLDLSGKCKGTILRRMVPALDDCDDEYQMRKSKRLFAAVFKDRTPPGLH